MPPDFSTHGDQPMCAQLDENGPSVMVTAQRLIALHSWEGAEVVAPSCDTAVRKCVEGDRSCGGYVERVHVARHRDADTEIRAGQPTW